MTSSEKEDLRPRIIKELDILRKLAATESAGPFKVRSYISAIKAIQALPFPLYGPEDLPPAQKGDGIGPKIREKILRILSGAELKISDSARSRSSALEAFQNVYGIGPKKAADLITAGFTTIEELRKGVAENSKLLNKNQQIGLRYYEPLLERIPRKEMDEHATLLMECKPAELEGVIVGSYRRGAATSGDIDMLLCTRSAKENAAKLLDQFVVALAKRGYILEILAHGDHKCMAISALSSKDGSGTPRRLDLLITPPEEFACAVFYFTGCDTFNVAIRQHALSLGFTLNEHALTRVKTKMVVKGIKSERDLFSLLGLEYVEPHERTGPEAVLLKSKPKSTKTDEY